jgi:hypothetical protein
MASHRLRCPGCGNPVGVPSLTPNLPGGEGPMTPMERMRHARNRKPPPGSEPSAEETTKPAPVPGRTVSLLSKRAVRPPDPGTRHLEKHWYECLLYPLRAWRLCLGLAVFLALLGGGMALVLPPLLNDPATTNPALVVLGLCWAVLLVFGLPCSFLECVMTSASAGEVYYIRWSGNLPLTLLLSSFKWLACFLAGPILFAGTAMAYWMSCGEAGPVDVVILTELGVIAISWWLFALLSVSDRGWLRDINPLAVIDLAHRLGWRGLLVVAGAALVLLGHGWVLLLGVAKVHTELFLGLMVQTGVWMSAVFWSTFFCRWLGVWCHRSRAAVEK